MATSTRKGKIGEAAIEVPKDVRVNMEESMVVVKGPLGECKKDFSKTPVQLTLEGERVIVKPYAQRKRDLAMVNTTRSLIKNMIQGVTEGFTYRLKIVYAHFPVSVKTKGDEVYVENFYGERSPRIAKIVGDCKVSVEGDDVVVKGVSKEDAGQTAANIEQVTRVKRKDQRVFLDGIYVYEKASSI